MHAYLIIGTDRDQLETEIEKIISFLKSTKLEFPLEKIADVRELAKFTKLSRNEPTTILIHSIEKASTEALNAFLKNLEEPQKNITFILTTSSVHKVLETIVSRCQIIRLKDRVKKNSKSEIDSFMNGTLSDKFKCVDTLRKREEAVEFIEAIIRSLHQSLVIKAENVQLTALNLKEAQKTLDALNANGNVRLQLSKFIIATHNL